MVSKKKDYSGILSAVAITGAIGGLLSYLLSTEYGKNKTASFKKRIDLAVTQAKGVRSGLVEDARTRGEGLTSKAAGILTLTKEFAAGRFAGPIEKIEDEFARVKAAIAAGFTSYKGNTASQRNTDEVVDDIFSNYEERTFTEFDDETWVKHEGMRHRFRKR